MKFLRYAKDGGPQSTVWGFWLIEIKSLFSVVLLCFDEGSREAYHSHAFNAVSWFIKGDVIEHHLDGRAISWRGPLALKYTPRSCFHKVYANKRTWCLSVRGPWAKTWNEYTPADQKFCTLTHGRKIVIGERQ